MTTRKIGPCAVEECGKNARNRGWCSMHYERWRLTGITDSQRPTLEQRFWAKVDKTGGPQACWPWTAATRTNTGYGVFGVTSKKIRDAHRIAYELSTGTLLGDLHIDHLCFNRLCVNPAHLRAVTQKQNNENRQGAQSNSLSGVRGVRYIPPGKRTLGRWLASAYQNGRNYPAGYFTTLEEAEEAARQKRLELFTHSDIQYRT